MITSNIIKPISVNAVKGVTRKGSSPTPEPDITDALLMEDGSLFLMEDGSYFKLEGQSETLQASKSYWKF